ncbi:aromatic ring-hydroxylating dioxygenase subunit alpha [Nocardia vinacea]|uniref:Aromatic ring-hydroxylating dioxygenase subunit alpha n=1 Tax=Nocardia vinacea TaxID=96468 RepID=A0ABZ1YQ04_9NOCA|nr:aromatic ring-hydroxylating dioxygenase subunit alpha [Nocardia vinacea]
MSLPAEFPRESWYVAAHSEEIGPHLLARTVMDEPIVFYRTANGEVTALADRCVHRRYPLSKGTLSGDSIVCGYHGFTYDPAGRCTAVPAQQRIPRTARVPRYPLVEQDMLVWVWIGDPERADPADIPRAPWLGAPGWAVVRGMAPLAARAGLLLDNLMDLSHETYLHADYIGSAEVAETPILTTVDEGTGVVRVGRHMDDAECPPAYRATTGLPSPEPDGTDPAGFHNEIVYAITPETRRSAHDFWAVARDFAVDNDELSRKIAAAQTAVVQQDVDALELLEQVISDEAAGYRELSVNLDTGGLAARRRLAQLTVGRERGAPR